MSPGLLRRAFTLIERPVVPARRSPDAPGDRDDPASPTRATPQASARRERYAVARGGRKRERNAFTLVELLVVIAIIGVLAALLSPSLSAARKKAQQIHCMNNLKQIGTATLNYANDYDGRIPHHDGEDGSWYFWPGLLEPYVSGKPLDTSASTKGISWVFMCPSDKMSLGPLSYLTPRPWACSYGINFEIYNFGGYPAEGYAGVQISKLQPPQQDLYISEHRKLYADFAALAAVYGQYPVSANWISGTNWGLLGSYHSRMVNALFADGHVECLPENQMTGDATLPPWSANDWIQALVK